MMLKEVFHDSFKIDWLIDKDLYGKPFNHDWKEKDVFLIQILLIFGGRCNRYFWDIPLKIYGLPNFNMLFHLVLQSELVLCLPTVDHVIN